MPKLSAQRIIASVDDMRRQLWPLWMIEKAMVDYYNGGLMPSLDGEETCSDDVQVSLGLGNRYIKKPFENLMDCILMEPGFIKTEVRYPLQIERRAAIESALDTELNKLVHDRMESVFRRVAGRSLITGRAFMYRLSRWDWKFRAGRLLHPYHYEDDIYADEWREWAFAGQITLRELDEKLSRLRNYKGAGWNTAGMQALKTYIIKSLDTEKEEAKSKDTSRFTQPFDDKTCGNVLDVYWYFRKSDDERDVDGKPKIDLYCVSRWGQNAVIVEQEGDGVTYKALEIKSQNESGNQILYNVPSAFENIDECLIALLLDSRVDGEQEMAQVEGIGKSLLPRLVSMEALTTSLLSGVSWAVQPNLTTQTGKAVDEEKLRELVREGIQPWDLIPNDVTAINKANSLTGLNSAMSILTMLGMSSEADGGTGEMSPLGESQAKFKAESDKLLQMQGQTISRRFMRFIKSIDKLAEQVTATLCRPFSQWMKGDAGYHDAKAFQTRMAIMHRIVPAEFSTERVFAQSRKVAGGLDRNTAIQKNTFMLERFGGQFAPEGVRYLVKEISRLTYGDSIADMLIPDQPQIDPNQMMYATSQNTQCIVSLLPVHRAPQDNPLIHIPIHEQALMARLQIAMQQGSISPFDQQGLKLLLMHLAEDVVALPKNAQQQLAPVLQKAATIIAKLPVQGASSKMALDMREQDRKDKQLQFQQQREQNLQGDREEKLKIMRNKMFLDMRRLLQQEKMDGVSRASQMMNLVQASLDMENSQREHDAFMSQTSHDMSMDHANIDVQNRQLDIQQQQVDQQQVDQSANS